jgi:predicted RNA binding protein with dsRBD fold (UPF0201 family)
LTPELRAKVTLEAQVSPSEDSAKVVQAVLNLVGDSPGELEQSDQKVRYVSEGTACLVHVRDQLRDRRVRGAARRLLTDARLRDTTELMINRQAAAAGVVALCGSPSESPLGPILLKIKSDQLEEVIGWLTAYEGG